MEEGILLATLFVAEACGGFSRGRWVRRKKKKSSVLFTPPSLASGLL